jgi:hypothetical protein
VRNFAMSKTVILKIMVSLLILTTVIGNVKRNNTDTNKGLQSTPLRVASEPWR